MYVYQHKDWPNWIWNEDRVNVLLLKVVAKQNQLLGKLSVLGFDSKKKTAYETGVLDVLTNSEIEGQKLLESQVRSSIAKNLGLNPARAFPAACSGELQFFPCLQVLFS